MSRERWWAWRSAFIDLAFGLGGIDGMTSADIKAYVRYIADWRLAQLKLRPQFGYFSQVESGYLQVRPHPLPWLAEILNGVEHANFFEQRATEYSKGATRGSWDGDGGVWSEFRQAQRGRRQGVTRCLCPRQPAPARPPATRRPADQRRQSKSREEIAGAGSHAFQGRGNRGSFEIVPRAARHRPVEVARQNRQPRERPRLREILTRCRVRPLGAPGVVSRTASPRWRANTSAFCSRRSSAESRASPSDAASASNRATIRLSSSIAPPSRCRYCCANSGSCEARTPRQKG